MDKAYIIAVDMGYGHQRAAFPFLDTAVAPEEWKINTPYIITANDYPGIPKRDMRMWRRGRGVYEGISRFRELPFLGERLFATMNHFERIEPFYPKRDLSKSYVQTRYIYRLINKRKLGKHLITELNKHPLPLVTTFFAVAFMAEEHGYAGEIYCLCTDTDISRAWAPRHPKNSRIVYLAPSHRVHERLKQYGVPEEKIRTTGFPLPKDLNLAASTTHRRIIRLDPTGKFRKKFAPLIEASLGKVSEHNEGPVSIAFAIGGAAAQYQIGLDVIASLAPDIKAGKFQLNLIAGISNKIYRIFENALKKHGLDEFRGKGVDIIYHPNRVAYFEAFNKMLFDTDILWTKPSELAFYAGYGLPIIIAPTLGSQEEYNQDWLHVVGAGIEQFDPKYANEWLSDWLEEGILSGMALNGYLNISKHGTQNIEDIIFGRGNGEMDEVHML
jgi:hypothetical protein